MFIDCTKLINSINKCLNEMPTWKVAASRDDRANRIRLFWIVYNELGMASLAVSDGLKITSDPKAFKSCSTEPDFWMSRRIRQNINLMSSETRTNVVAIYKSFPPSVCFREYRIAKTVRVVWNGRKLHLIFQTESIKFTCKVKMNKLKYLKVFWPNIVCFSMT